MTRDEITALPDAEAVALFERLVTARFKSKLQFAEYVGLRKQTVYQWSRPPLWALLWLTEWERAQIDRQALAALRLALDCPD